VGGDGKDLFPRSPGSQSGGRDRRSWLHHIHRARSRRHPLLFRLFNRDRGVLLDVRGLAPVHIIRCRVIKRRLSIKVGFLHTKEEKYANNSREPCVQELQKSDVKKLTTDQSRRRCTHQHGLPSHTSVDEPAKQRSKSGSEVKKEHVNPHRQTSFVGKELGCTDPFSHSID
jgi:hypothetical protein